MRHVSLSPLRQESDTNGDAEVAQKNRTKERSIRAKKSWQAETSRLGPARGFVS